MAVYDIVKQTNKNWSSNSSKTLWKTQRSAVNLFPDRAGKSWIGSSESESGAAACPSGSPTSLPPAHPHSHALPASHQPGRSGHLPPHSRHNHYKKVHSQDVQSVYWLLTLLSHGAGKEHTRTELDLSTLIFLQLWCLSDWIHFGKCQTVRIDVFVFFLGIFPPLLWKDLTFINCIKPATKAACCVCVFKSRGDCITL